MSVRWVLVAVALEACSAKTPGSDDPNCAGGVEGKYTIAASGTTPSGACDAVQPSNAFATGSLVIAAADGGYAVSTTDTTPLTDVVACGARESSCFIRGTCTSSAVAGAVKQSFDFEVSGNRVNGTLKSTLTTKDGDCTFSVPFNGGK